MTLDEIDALLSKWQKDIQTATSNLVAFEESPAFKAVKSIAPKLEGKTQEVVAKPIAELELVWEHFNQLNEVIKEAAHLRKNMPLFGKADRIRQIEQLLAGPSICLQLKEIPLEERGLTGASHLQKMTSPADVMKLMQTRFLDGTRAVATYEKSCQDLDKKLAEIESDLTVKFSNDLDTQLAEIRAVAHSDPLTGLDKIQKLKKPSVVKPAPPLKMDYEIPKSWDALSIGPPLADPKPAKDPVLSEIEARLDKIMGKMPKFETPKPEASAGLADLLAKKPETWQFGNPDFFAQLDDGGCVTAGSAKNKIKPDPQPTQSVADLFSQPTKPVEPVAEESALEDLIRGETPLAPTPKPQSLEDLFGRKE